jgi:hypothetical protein
MGIHCRQGIIHKNHFGIEVDSTSDVQTLLLSSRDCDTALANLGLIAIGEYFKVGSQGTSINDFVVPFLVVVLSNRMLLRTVAF